MCNNKIFIIKKLYYNGILFTVDIDDIEVNSYLWSLKEEYWISTFNIHIYLFGLK